ncbi:MAG: ABC transporter permease, partial [Sulfobacillus sp.]
MNREIGRGLLVLAILVIWWIVTGLTHLIDPLRLPSPESIWAALVQISTRGYAGATLPVHILTSLKLIVEGFGLSVIVGFPIGLSMGLSRRWESFINPVFQGLRAVPPLAWIPLSILWFGIGSRAQLFIIWYAATPPMILNTWWGVRQIPSSINETAAVFGAGRWRRWKSVVVPGAVVQVFTGLRLSLQVSWMALVAAELVGSKAGLGHIMIIGARAIDP